MIDFDTICQCPICGRQIDSVFMKPIKYERPAAFYEPIKYKKLAIPKRFPTRCCTVLICIGCESCDIWSPMYSFKVDNSIPGGRCSPGHSLNAALQQAAAAWNRKCKGPNIVKGSATQRRFIECP